MKAYLKLSNILLYKILTLSGVYNAPSTFYMGTTGGGVWKTKDNGINWKNISDGFLEEV